MTKREVNLAIFEGTTDKVLWQPRLEMWINHHTQRGTLPERLKGMSRFEIYDALGCSVRYGAGVAVRAFDGPGVKREDQETQDHTISVIRTPAGELRTVQRNIWEDGHKVNHRIEEYPVKTVQDLHVLTDLMERRQIQADAEKCREVVNAIGDRGETAAGLGSSGFTDLIKWWCGLPDTFYLLHEHPAEVERYLEACDRWDDRVLDETLKLPYKLFELGDHANNEFTPPPILRKYMIPRWQRITDRLHAQGRYAWSHWDGNSRHILPFLRETHLDAVEALTPEPMGDMSLEMIKEAVGHGPDQMVCLDLLPVIDFLPNCPTEKLLDFTKRVIDMFAPRLILGVSDELSSVGQIEKIEAISELVDKTCGLA